VKLNTIEVNATIEELNYEFNPEVFIEKESKLLFKS